MTIYPKTNMLKQLPVLFMCVSSICLCTRAQDAHKVGFTRNYGVQLCGREFIRAVIFTCGGSRWKRSENDVSLQSKENPYSVLTNSEDRLSLHQRGEVSAENLHALTSSRVDLLSAFSDFNNREPGLDKVLQLGNGRLWGQPMMLGGPQEGGGNTPWSSPTRGKRNLSLGLAGMCCNKGCTKNDIGRLC
ncbi:hypothetical protein AAFF_G00425530 [Aldrovandia affinis]|uniref:Insulin-like domain-containing protein n=1 Tax=Aldrovandia affinis TaxID=143900 RepID=A0AAD7X0C7_9TELE|nr:hypothetical protein AAFF_G00425530 [Aldrovandia affinis]